ncbi:hypothetical protein H2198_002037 [Neophaeococcomyces mojaviensis]|uniref:Uncharacterized protein n=1 Tax=Neophaeococcomyces mojaviensis TaxID=3383035 RepID=A0ACC3AFC8_9EURO|nr:hypothetical protein H2198_002037 [Knufia sp. JES_112]
MGPGDATFHFAAESFPTPLRDHFVGFAAAVGKAGAAIGTQVIAPIQESFPDPQKGIQSMFLIGASFAAIGSLISWFPIPDKSRDLEDEKARFRGYLAANGYVGSFGESLEEEIKTTSYEI